MLVLVSYPFKYYKFSQKDIFHQNMEWYNSFLLLVEYHEGAATICRGTSGTLSCTTYEKNQREGYYSKFQNYLRLERREDEKSQLTCMEYFSILKNNIEDHA